MAHFGVSSEVWTSNVFSDPPQEIHDSLTVRRFRSIFLSRREATLAGAGKAAISLPLLWSVARYRELDLLHLHTHNRMTAFLVLIARLKRIPVVLTMHSEFRVMTPKWRFAFPNEYAIRNAHLVITVNDRIRRSLTDQGIRHQRTLAIPNGVEVERFDRGDGRTFRSTISIGDAPLVVTPGRICDVKNQLMVLDVLPNLLARIPTAHWVVVGPPSEPEYYRLLEREVTRRQLQDRLHLIPGFAPESDELAHMYAAADVVVLTSKHEAFPLVVLEAWAARKPVVAPAAGGLVDIIRHGENGLTVPPHDSSLMANAIAELLTDEQQRALLGGAGRQQAEGHTWPRIAQEVLVAYNAAARANKPAR